MKKIVLVVLFIFLQAVPTASAASFDETKNPRDKADQLLLLIDQYSVLVNWSKQHPDAESCKKVGDLCISYQDIYNGLVAQYAYYANQQN